MNLLIGNGINRLGNNDLNWVNLLKNILNSLGLKNKIDFIKKPYLHIYEEIYTVARINEKDLKNKIAEKLISIEPNMYHDKVMEIGFKNILTTNYDYNLTSSTIKNKETLYSLYRYQVENNTKVWHIHGELNVPNSIMLGYDHYLKSISNIHNLLETKEKRYRDIIKEDWVSIFIYQDIYILGLELDFGELDLWWLLSHRNRLIISGKKVQNKIVYITDNNQKSKDTKSKLSMMRTFGVEVKEFNLIDNNYNKFYDDVLLYLNKKNNAKY